MERTLWWRRVLAFALLACASSTALAQDPGIGGKLLLTGGLSQVEGAAGGGIAPWALIGGYGTEDQIGASAFHTRVELDDYRLQTVGVLVGLYNRVELSYAHQRFDTQAVGAALGLGEGFDFEQEILGVKVRLVGDAVLEQDRWLPQIALGVQHKRNHEGQILRAIGADSDSGTDVYLSATKLLLDRSLLLNATLRHTKANQIGILGFGGDRRGSASLQFEGSAAWLIGHGVAVGAEYRGKPDNLGIASEDDWWDAFIAWAPNKHIALTLAYVDLGDIVIAQNQRGLYLSLQLGF